MTVNDHLLQVQMKNKQYGRVHGGGLRAINVVYSQTNTTFQPRRLSSAESVAETVAFKGDEAAPDTFRSVY